MFLFQFSNLSIEIFLIHLTTMLPYYFKLSIQNIEFLIDVYGHLWRLNWYTFCLD